MSRKPTPLYLLGFLLFLLACYFPLFLHLDSLSLRLWDEARRGVNALTMAEEGHWLTPHFVGGPDHWGTKPPLLVWLQAIFFKMGLSPELAVRLPSALAGLSTALLLAWAGKRVLAVPAAGFLAALVLLTSGLYIDAHGAVAGDYDALLVLWLTAHVLSFFLYVRERTPRWLYLSGLCLLLAGWTKGVAAFFFLPGLLLFALIHQPARSLFADRRLYLTALAAGAGVLAYYLIREQLYPGYLQLVWENELGGRYFTPKEGHGWGPWFYLRVVTKYELFFPWQYFIPLGYWLMLRNDGPKDLGKLLLIAVLSFLLIVSASATKLIWYVQPLLPLLALVVGYSLERLWKGLLLVTDQHSGPCRLALASFFLLAIFAFPYARIVQKVYGPFHQGPEREAMSYRDFFRRLPPGQSLTVVLPSYNGHFSFYQRVFAQQGYDIRAVYLKRPDIRVQAVADTVRVFQAGEMVGFCEQAASTYMEEHYRSEVQLSWENCKLVRITGNKNNDP